MLAPFTYLARYKAFCSGEKKAMSPMDGFTLVGKGVGDLDLFFPLTTFSCGKIFSNVALKRTALP
jgi:hypothetical protein